MKAFLAFLLMVSCPLAMQAKIWIVDNNVGSTSKDFTTLQAGYNGAGAGDTLFMIGSPVNYLTAKVTMTKKLVIIGPGYFLSENPDTQANINSAILQNTVSGCDALDFAAGSEGSVLMGMEILGSIKISTDNIMIKRNHIRQIACIATAVDIDGSNIFFIQNFVSIDINITPSVITVATGNSNIIVANNYLYHNCYNCGGSIWGLQSTGSSLEVSNNVFVGGINVSNALIQNNIFTTVNFFTATSSTVRNNLHYDNGALPAGNGNFNLAPATMFVGTGSTDGKWLLAAGSFAIGKGFGGTDCGIFGGLEPYVLSGVPPIPDIYFFTAPAVGDKANGLPIQIKVKSRN